MGITWIVELIKFVRNGRNFFSAYSLRLIMNECSDYNFPKQSFEMTLITLKDRQLFSNESESFLN